MCLPLVPLIAIGAAVATTAVSVVGQIQSANAANKAIKAQLAAKDHEIDLAASHEINDRLRQARREQGRILVAAGESGLSLESGSVNALLEDAQMQATLSNETSLANRESRRQAARAEANAALVAKPTVLGAGLQIGLAGLNAAASHGAFGGSGSGASH